MEKSIKVFAVILVLLFIGILFMGTGKKVEQLKGTEPNIGTANASNTSVLVGIETAVAIVSKKDWKYLSFCIDGDIQTASTVYMYLMATDTETVNTNSGRPLNPGDCWEFYPDKFVWQNMIYGIATTSTTTVNVTSYSSY